MSIGITKAEFKELMSTKSKRLSELYKGSMSDREFKQKMEWLKNLDDWINAEDFNHFKDQQQPSTNLRTFREPRSNDTLAEVEKLADELENLQSKNKTLASYFRISMSAVLVLIAIVIYLPFFYESDWFINHPNRSRLELSFIIMIGGGVWAIIDRNKVRQQIAIGSVVISSFIGLTQLI